MKRFSCLLLVFCLVLTGCKDLFTYSENITPVPNSANISSVSASTDNTNSLTFSLYGYDLVIPDYVDCPYYEVNGNKPLFKSEEIMSDYYESYSGLDDLGRCQVAMACLSRDTMPLPYEKREDIGSVKPAGWQTAKYPELINGLYLYNRCHLIGWQLSAENANPMNLTTGTRYLNVDGMLPFENKVDAYIEKTDHHVMYRVTPIFVGDELVCRGILMEAQSVEDNDCVFCVYCYNIQPGIEIDYATGNSWVKGDVTPVVTEAEKKEVKKYVLNNKTMKVHRPDCSSITDIGSKNIEEYEGYLETLLSEGYVTCKKCKPD